MSNQMISIERQVELIKNNYDAENRAYEEVPHFNGPLDGIDAPIPLLDGLLPDGQQYQFSLDGKLSRNHIYQKSQVGHRTGYLFIGTIDP